MERFRLIFVLVIGLLVAVFIGTQIAEENYWLSIIVVLLFCFFTIVFVLARGVPLDGVFLWLVILGYMIGGKGFAYQNIGGILFIGEITLLVCGIAYGFRIFLKNQPIIPNTSLTIPLLILLAYGAIRLIFFDFKQYGFWAAKDSCMVYYTLFFFIGYQLHRVEGFFSFFKKYIVIAGLLFVVPFQAIYRYIESVQYFVIEITTLPGRAPLILPHIDANLSVFFGVMAFSYLSFSRSRKYKLFYWGVFMATIIYIIILSRGMAFVALAFMAAFLVLAGEYKFLIHLFSVGCLGLAVVLIFFLLGVDNKMPLVDKVVGELKSFDVTNLGMNDQPRSHGQSTAKWRLYWWKKIFHDTLEQNPSFGAGFGKDISTEFHREFYGEGDYISSKWERIRGAHSVVFTVIARLGFVGFAILLWVLLIQFWKIFQAARLFKAKRLDVQDAFLWGCVVCSMAVALFQYTWEAPYSAIPFWVIYGVAQSRLDLLLSKKGKESNFNNHNMVHASV